MNKDQTKMIGDLSRNMDSVLSKITSIDNRNSSMEDSIRDLSKIGDVSKFSDMISEKLKGGVLADLSGKIDGKIGDGISKGIKEFGKSKNFSDILTGDIGNKISEMIGKIGDNSPKVNIPFKDLSKADSSDIFSKLSDLGIPGFKDGGEIQKNGMALVGEEGPELIMGNQGDQVVSKYDLEDSLLGLKTEKDANSKDNVYSPNPDSIEFSILATTAQKVIRDNFPDVEILTKDVFENFVEDIEKIEPSRDRKDFLSMARSEDEILSKLEPWLEDNNLLKIDTFTPEDVKGLTEPIDMDSEQEKISLEDSLEESKGKDKESKRKDKGKKRGRLKEFLNEKTSGVREMVSTFLDPLKDLKNNSEETLTDNVPDSLDSIKNPAESEFSLENGFESLKSIKEVPEPIKEQKESTNTQNTTTLKSSAESNTTESNTADEKNSTSKSTGDIKSAESGSPMNSNVPSGLSDGEAVALLTEIRNLLSGPLRVLNSTIERPNSRFK